MIQLKNILINYCKIVKIVFEIALIYVGQVLWGAQDDVIYTKERIETIFKRDFFMYFKTLYYSVKL